MDENSVLASSAAVWLRLPSAPAFMCIMRTLEGKPVGVPIWKTFQNQPDKLALTNETMSSTFLNLSKNLLSISPERAADKDSVLRISFGGKTWNIYIPPLRSEFQFSFIVAFEDKDTIEIGEKAREQLTREIVKKLQKITELKEIIEGNRVVESIEMNDPLYQRILETISQAIKKWDSSRIKYLQAEAEKLRKRLIEEAKEKEKLEKSNI